jgi:hypothetical protein
MKTLKGLKKGIDVNLNKVSLMIDKIRPNETIPYHEIRNGEDVWKKVRKLRYYKKKMLDVDKLATSLLMKSIEGKISKSNYNIVLKTLIKKTLDTDRYMNEINLNMKNKSKTQLKPKRILHPNSLANLRPKSKKQPTPFTTDPVVELIINAIRMNKISPSQMKYILDTTQLTYAVTLQLNHIQSNPVIDENKLSSIISDAVVSYLKIS